MAVTRGGRKRAHKTDKAQKAAEYAQAKAGRINTAAGNYIPIPSSSSEDGMVRGYRGGYQIG